jgi:uncharacterized protein YjaG (DUF416 family)
MGQNHICKVQNRITISSPSHTLVAALVMTDDRRASTNERVVVGFEICEDWDEEY